MFARIGGDNGSAEVGALAAALAILGVPLPLITLLLALTGIAMSGAALVKLDRVVKAIEERNAEDAQTIAALADSPSGEAKGGT